MFFSIKIGPNNYLKVTNVDRNEPRGFYRNSKLTTFRGRKEVHKNKWTPHCQTEFDGESEKNNRFAP